jgi:hypothetical protein
VRIKFPAGFPLLEETIKMLMYLTPNWSYRIFLGRWRNAQEIQTTWLDRVPERIFG